MTNNLDEFEQPDMDANGGGPQKQGARANIMHAWRTRPLFKLGVLMAIAAAVIMLAISFFSSPKPTEVTKLATPPQGFKGAPGGASTPYFIEQTKKAEEERTNTAIRTGGDALPTPLGANASIDEMTADKNKKDPLVELRAQIEQQKQKIAQIEQQKQQNSQQPQAKEQFDDSLAQAMQKQLQQMQASWDPKGIKEVGGKTDERDEAREKEVKDEKERAKTFGGGTGGMVNGAMIGPNGEQKFGIPIINAGTISYAQMLTEANSDTPGPILAQILSGPLKGARAIGSFTVENDYLVLKFTLANLNNIDYSIDAYALDPDTTLPAMATEVDERYFTRVLLPAAAGFMQGFGQALGQNSSSVVTNGDTTIVQQSGKGLQQGLFTGLGQAGQTMSQFFQQQANDTKPLVRVAAGTPMGMFFLQTVCTGTGCTLNNMVENRMQGNMQGNMNGYPNGNPNGNPNGYPNTGYNGYMPGFTPGYAPGYNGYPGQGYGTTNNALSNGTGVVGYTPTNNPASTPAGGPYTNNSSPYGSNNSSLLQPNGGLNIISGSPGLGTPVVNP